MKLITVQMLKGACPEQRKLFHKVFPGGAPVTMEAALKAQKAGLDVFWMINQLPPSLYDDYWAKRKPLDDDYWAKRKLLCDDYWAKRIRVLLPLLRKVAI